MHLVAVHKLQGEPTEQAQALAKALGVTPYEARQRLVATPAFVAREPSEPAAKTRAAKTATVRN